MTTPTSLRFVSGPVKPTMDEHAQRALDDLAVRAMRERDAVVDLLARQAVPLQRSDMLGALHIIEPAVGLGDTMATVEEATARNANMVTLAIEIPTPTLASFWPWVPGDAPDRISTLLEALAVQ